MATVCVTGGAGFIGSNLVRRCLENGDRVKVVDDFSTGRIENLKDIEENIKLIEADVRDEEIMRDVLGDVKTVYHQAAMPSVPRSMEGPVWTSDITLMGTVKLLKVAAEMGVERLVYASSSSVYGNQPGFPRSEDMKVAPESPYAASKASCELFAAVFSSQFPIETVGLRYFNVFGPRQDPSSDYAAVVPAFITALIRGERPSIYGDGEQSRDFTYVEEVVKANLIAAKKGKSGRVYNVAYQQKITVNNLFEMIRNAVGSELAAKYEAPRPGDVKCSYGDRSLLSGDTGFEPSFSVEEGLLKTVEWYKENLN